MNTKPTPSSGMQIFDRDVLDVRRRRKARDFSRYDFLFAWAERQMLESLSLITRSFENVLIIGGRRSEGFYDKLKAACGHHARLSVFDLNDAYHDKSRSYALHTGDEEFLPFDPQSFDLVISNLNFHTINDLPGLLIQIRRLLKPDGLLVGSLFGGETLYQLRDCLTRAELATKGGVSPRVHPFATKQDMGALMQRAGYALPVIDSDILTVTYDHIFKLMQDLRGMGETNIIAARDRKYPGKTFFAEAAQFYAQNYAEPGSNRIEACFEVIFIHGWAPHENQQKPLKPGSAKQRMADALDTEEKPL